MCYAFAFVGFIAWYIPYYNERLDQYNKHNFVLREECMSGKLHPEIQHNEMTFDGLSTNCTRAKVFISIPVWLGALNNMWEGSVFYTLIHATSWQIQVAYVLFGLVFCVVVVMEVSKHIKWSKVASLLGDKKSISINDQQTGRTRILRKTIPSNNNNQIKTLAQNLIRENSQSNVPKPNLLIKSKTDGSSSPLVLDSPTSA